MKTNEAPIVIYEQLVEGEYRFLLKVWTNDNELSQDTVHVYVHSSTSNSDANSTISLNSSLKSESPSLNDNIVQIELDIKPSLFSEYLKEQFLTKLQILLQQQVELKLKQPKVILVNTKIIINSKGKSSVLLELIISDILDEKIKTADLKISQIENVYSEDTDLIGENRKIVKSAVLVKLLRKKQKTFKTLLNSMHTFIQRMQATNVTQELPSRPSVLDFLDIKILSISQLTCTDDSLFIHSKHVNKYNCSNHGKCDLHSHKCICDKYWMPNLYLYYFDYESDLTNGNNCGK